MKRVVIFIDTMGSYDDRIVPDKELNTFLAILITRKCKILAVEPIIE